MREEQSGPPIEEPPGVSLVDVLSLPDELQMIVTWLMRQGEAGLPEVAALIQQDEAIANTLLADLVAQGFVQEVPTEGEGQTSYRVRLASKRTRKLSLDL
jgi:Mn-dependent DtxR family transcriptional regulator